MCGIVSTYHDTSAYMVKKRICIYYIYVYIHTVEGVCSRLIFDYHCNIYDRVVGCIFLYVIAIEEEKRKREKEREKKGIIAQITSTFKKYKSIHKGRFNRHTSSRYMLTPDCYRI